MTSRLWDLPQWLAVYTEAGHSITRDADDVPKSRRQGDHILIWCKDCWADHCAACVAPDAIPPCDIGLDRRARMAALEENLLREIATERWWDSLTDEQRAAELVMSRILRDE